MGRRGLSSVYGFLVIYLLLIGGIAAISQVSSSELSLRQSFQREQALQSMKTAEQISLLPAGDSLRAFNYGSTPSQLQFIIVRAPSGISVIQTDTSVPPGSYSILPLYTQASTEGVVTSLGNVFWYNPANSSSIPNGCTRGTATLTMVVSPSGSGSTIPAGVQTYCLGQTVQVSASPLPGYEFASWSGTGNGSYTGSSNPATVTLNSNLKETAFFVPAVKIISVLPGADGYSYGQSNTAKVVVSGIPQKVTLSASNVPPQTSVSFNPSSFTDSMTGSASTMTVSYSGPSYLTNYTLIITATGSDGSTSSYPYTIVATPPDGYFVESQCCYPGQAQYTPRLHRTAYWAGTYFSFFVSDSVMYYFSTSYSGGSWTSTGPTTVSGSCRNVPYDVEQRGPVVLLADLVPAYGVWFNFAVAAGGKLQWHFQAGLNCWTGVQVATKYFPYAPDGLKPVLSVSEDASGRVWLAVNTYDNSGHFHVEVLEMSLAMITQICCNNVQQWNEMYVSPPLPYPALPSLFTPPNGDVLLVYSVASSPCPGEYLLYTTNVGLSWSQPAGPETTTSLSSPLCYASSAGTLLGDTVYFGGVNSRGDLAFWSFNLDNSTFRTSQTVASAVESASITSVGDVLVLAYQQSYSYYITKSYDGGITWSQPAKQQIPFNGPFTLPVLSSTYQIPSVGLSFAGGSYIQLELFTV